MTENHWKLFERTAKVGGVLVSITVGWMVLTAAMEAIDLRVTAIETFGSAPHQKALREINTALGVMQREQAVMKYLACRAPENRLDSTCENVPKP